MSTLQGLKALCFLIILISSSLVEAKKNLIHSKNEDSIDEISTTSPPSQPNGLILSLPKQYNLIPMRRIGNTTLYSGIFYRLGMKKFPSGWVTWTNSNSTNKEGNYLEIDMNPNNLPYYNKGSKWENEVQWSFAPTLVEGAYTLRNKGKPSSLAMISYQSRTDYEHVILVRDPKLISSLSVDSSSPSESALFKPSEKYFDPSNPQMYGIRSFKNPKGIITWTEMKYGRHSYYIQLSTNPEHRPNYKKSGEWYDDQLFRFDPPKVRLYGTITDFLFSNSTWKQILDKPRKVSVLGESETLFNYMDSPFIQKLSKHAQTDNTLSISIDSNSNDKIVHIFKDLKASISLPNLPPGFNYNFKSDVDINPGTLESKEVCFLNEFTIETEVELASKSAANVTYLVEKIENMELPFKALISVTGLTDRILGDYSTTQLGPAPEELVMNELIKAGAITKDSNSPKVWVSGTIYGSFVVNSRIIVEQFLRT